MTRTPATAAALHYAAVTPSHRAVAWSLAALVSLSLLAGVSQTADRVHGDALLAQASQPQDARLPAAELPVQVVVVTAQRLPRG